MKTTVLGSSSTTSTLVARRLPVFLKTSYFVLTRIGLNRDGPSIARGAVLLILGSRDRTSEVITRDSHDRHIASRSRRHHRIARSQKVGGRVERDREEFPIPTVVGAVAGSHTSDPELPRNPIGDFEEWILAAARSNGRGNYRGANHRPIQIEAPETCGCEGRNRAGGEERTGDRYAEECSSS